MRTIWMGWLVCASLFGQADVEPMLECVDTVTKTGKSRIVASTPAGTLSMSFTQPLPLGASVVLNPGGANQETIQIGVWRTFSSPYEAGVTSRNVNVSPVPLAFAHSAGELAVVESQESAAYWGFFNFLSTPVTLSAGSVDNYFVPLNSNAGQPSTFPSGGYRNNFVILMPTNRIHIWTVNGQTRTASRDPALACGNVGPQVRAEPITVGLGGSMAGVRLGTVTGGSPGPLTLNPMLVFHHSLSANQRPTVTGDVQFSNVRLENGVISGDVVSATTALSRHYFFILSVSDSTGRTGRSTSVADVVNQCPIPVTPSLLQTAYVNTPYNVSFTAGGVQGQVSFELEGTLPVGLSMSARGRISGTPVQTGSFPLALRSTAEDGCFSRLPLTLEVQGQLCAAEVTPLVEITFGGFRQNLVTRRWQQTVTLRNSGQSSIFGPLALVVDSLSPNAALVASGGTTTCTAPLGRPYVEADLGPNRLLAPGATVAVALEFTNSAPTSPITYTPRVIAGGAIR